jgi:hypothetical protein
MTGNIKREVPRPRASQSNDRESAARAQEAGHPLERRADVQMVERGDRSHEVEALRLERVRHEVTDDVGDALAGSPPCQGEARLVTVDANDVVHALAKPLGEKSLAAADVQRAFGIVRDRRKNDRVIVDVVIPGLDQPILPPLPIRTPFDYPPLPVIWPGQDRLIGSGS